MNDAELNELRARIESLERQQELLLYTVTHDLRTPVMTILGFADLLLTDWQNNHQQSQSRAYLERIRSAAHRQSQMIQDLQKMTQLQRASLQPQLVELSAVAQEQLDALIRPGSSFTATITSTPAIRCDLETMKIALNALLSNALKLSVSALVPTIEFGLEAQNDLNCFYVRSNGTGFDLGQDQSLLAVFRRLQTGTDLAGTGTALLAATMIIHRHGGKLWIHTSPDCGTTVYFLLNA